MSAEKPKPCPFCGSSEIDVEPWHGGGIHKHRVGCANEFCDAAPSVTGKSKPDAIRRWNTRAGDDHDAR